MGRENTEDLESVLCVALCREKVAAFHQHTAEITRLVRNGNNHNVQYSGVLRPLYIEMAAISADGRAYYFELIKQSGVALQAVMQCGVVP